MRTITVCLTEDPGSRETLDGESPGTGSVRLRHAVAPSWEARKSFLHDSGDGTFEAGWPAFDIAGYAEVPADGRVRALGTPEAARSAIRHAERIVIVPRWDNARSFEGRVLLEQLRRENPHAEIVVRPYRHSYMVAGVTERDGEAELPLSETILHPDRWTWSVMPYMHHNFNRAGLRVLPAMTGTRNGVEVRQTPSILDVQMLFVLAEADRARASGDGLNSPIRLTPRFGKGGTFDRVDEWQRFLLRGGHADWVRAYPSYPKGLLSRLIAKIVPWKRPYESIRPADRGLTEAGRAAFSKISPELRDPALFGRIDAWTRMDLERAAPEIDAYARRFHDIQKRHAEMTGGPP